MYYNNVLYCCYSIFITTVTITISSTSFSTMKSLLSVTARNIHQNTQKPVDLYYDFICLLSYPHPPPPFIFHFNYFILLFLSDIIWFKHITTFMMNTVITL